MPYCINDKSTNAFGAVNTGPQLLLPGLLRPPRTVTFPTAHHSLSIRLFPSYLKLSSVVLESEVLRKDNNL